MDRKDALALLQKYNHEPFHILHALTVEGVMKWYANESGYGRVHDYIFVTMPRHLFYPLFSP